MTNANETYQQLLEEMEHQMIVLKKKIAKHAKEQELKPKDWGFVGDMGHWVDQIKNITEPK